MNELHNIHARMHMFIHAFVCVCVPVCVRESVLVLLHKHVQLIQNQSCHQKLFKIKNR